MLVSELIKQLEDLKAAHGDLEVQTLVPEGPYTRCEGPPEFMGIGWCDEEGEFIDSDKREEMILEVIDDLELNDRADAEAELDHLDGPYLCIGAIAIE